MKYNFIFLVSIFISPIFSECPEGGATYKVDDEICLEHQNKEFEDICHGDYPKETFKLSDFQNKVIWLHFSATW